MEKFLKGAVMILGLIMAICLTMLFGKFVYQEYFGKPDPTICDCSQQPQQPIVFNSISNALEEYHFLHSEYEYEDIFLSMTPETLEEITGTLLQRQPSCTIKDIAMVYRERYAKIGHKDRQIEPEPPTPVNTGVPLCPTQQSDTSTTVTNTNTQ